MLLCFFAAKTPKKPKTTKGFHASRNAYMLVYKARKPEGAPKEREVVNGISDLPMRMQKFLELDDNRFDQWIDQMVLMRVSR